MSVQMDENSLIFSVSDFVASLNQTLEFAYPTVIIEGELANFRISKGRWVYFDLKDEYSSVKFFATIYQLPGPLEDGMLLRVSGVPRLHQQFGFSVTAQVIQPVGEGSIKRAANLLEATLHKEGLFDVARKRILPYPPQRIGLITSLESAAYADFIKIINRRWVGLSIELADVQVQGLVAPAQIVKAVEWFNEQATLPDVLVIIRGGGSAEDLSAFSTENVTRAIAGSRIPTLVAIGHEIDVSLAEKVADKHASTPSNAAELLVPDKQHELKRLAQSSYQLSDFMANFIKMQNQYIKSIFIEINSITDGILARSQQKLAIQQDFLDSLSPQAVLRRGYAILRANKIVVRSGNSLKIGDTLQTEIVDSIIYSKITDIKLDNEKLKLV